MNNLPPLTTETLEQPSRLCSDRWRDIFEQFQSLAANYPGLRADWDYIVGSGKSGEWRLAGGQEIAIQFETLAKRASALLGLSSASLLQGWLEELMRKSFNFSYGSERVESNDDGSEGARHLSGTISRLCEASAKYCSELEGRAVEAEALTEIGQLGRAKREERPVSAADAPADGEKELPKRSFATVFGRNLDRLRRESGWSFDEMEVATGIAKNLSLGHVNKGKGAHPSTMAIYAKSFSERLGRDVTVAELEG